MDITNPCTNPFRRRYDPSSGCGRHNHATSTIPTSEARPRLLMRRLLTQLPLSPWDAYLVKSSR
ncbi:hypothetical protein AVEN_180069-1, partial [Araneus ventricosus]